MSEDPGLVPGLKTWACRTCGHVALAVRQPAKCPRCGEGMEER